MMPTLKIYGSDGYGNKISITIETQYPIRHNELISRVREILKKQFEEEEEY